MKAKQRNGVNDMLIEAKLHTGRKGVFSAQLILACERISLISQDLLERMKRRRDFSGGYGTNYAKSAHEDDMPLATLRGS